MSKSMSKSKEKVVEPRGPVLKKIQRKPFVILLFLLISKANESNREEVFIKIYAPKRLLTQNEAIHIEYDE